MSRTACGDVVARSAPSFASLATRRGGRDPVRRRAPLRRAVVPVCEDHEVSACVVALADHAGALPVLRQPRSVKIALRSRSERVAVPLLWGRGEAYVIRETH